MTGVRRSIGRATAAMLVAVLMAAGLSALATTPAAAVERGSKVAAVTASQWRAGNIISDSLFYDSKAMTSAEIQTFLDAKIGPCTNGKCLDVIRVSAATYPAEVSARTGNTVCTAVSGGTMSVAAWIYRVQVACGISAKVILVTLQKEQGLVTKTAPADYALRYAMGMGCPDTTGCTNAPQGLATQIYLGTKQLKTYKAGAFARQPGVHSIQWHPNGSCGSTQVRVENYATAALYNYTPYQPNSAALANMYGTGNSCSSYGNRNFWRYYNDWFGSTQGTAFGWIDSGPGVYAVNASGDLLLYAGNGKGSWKATSTLGNGWHTMEQVFGAGDIDGDGHRDVLALDSSGTLWNYPSDGVSAFGTRVEVDGDWADATALFSPGDFTGDKRVDLVTRDASGALWLHAGDGRGGFRTAVLIGAGWNIYDRILGVGDFSGDSRADIMARDPQGKLWLYRGNAVGGFTGSRQQIGAGWNIFNTIVAPGDFNGDKRQDVLARNAAGQLMLYRGNGAGGWLGSAAVGQGFGSMGVIAGLGSMPGAVTVPKAGVGDLTADGRRDLIARDTSGNWWIYPGSGAGKFLPRRAFTPPWPTTAIGADDFDGDSARTGDLLALDDSGVLWLYPGVRGGGFGPARQVATGWDEMDWVGGVGDLNSDRIPDVLARDAAGALWLYPGNGSGGLRDRVQVGNGWNIFEEIVTTGDFDGDRIADVIGIEPSGKVWLYRGVGDGTWVPRVVIGNGWQIMSRVFSPGDFNGDGRSDLIARESSGVLWLYPGNGAGAFQARVKIGSGWQIFDYIA